MFGLPCMVDDHVVYAGHDTDGTIDAHFAVPAILVEQHVMLTHHGEPYNHTGMVALHKELARHAKEFGRQLENSAPAVILAHLETHGGDKVTVILEGWHGVVLGFPFG